MPELPELEARLQKCFSAVFPNLSADEILRANSASLATWDSLATVTLVSVIEEEFGISIAPEEYEYMISFDLIRQSLESKAVNA
ncbi:MAG TPA: acyl carrier protein [Pyrinomonadaceae bacterium]|nr:acyl carrier protein [Pyrinomonadaceae bacterium]